MTELTVIISNVVRVYETINWQILAEVPASNLNCHDNTTLCESLYSTMSLSGNVYFNILGCTDGVSIDNGVIDISERLYTITPVALKESDLEFENYTKNRKGFMITNPLGNGTFVDIPNYNNLDNIQKVMSHLSDYVDQNCSVTINGVSGINSQQSCTAEIRHGELTIPVKFI